MLNEKKALLILAYSVLITIFIVSFNVRGTGDTVALINGLDQAIECLSARSFQCDASVVHFPIFQYLVGAPGRLFGFDTVELLGLFQAFSCMGFAASIFIFYRAASIGADHSAGGHLGILVLISGYLPWYANATFNESVAFAMFAALALGVICDWRPSIVACIAFLCTITKEIAFPFVLYFAVVAYLSRAKLEINGLNDAANVFKQFVKRYKSVFISVFIGVAINLAFNIFRFGTLVNTSNTVPEFMAPIEFRPDFFRALFFSPSGGLLYVWFSLCCIFCVAFLFRLVSKAEMIPLALAFGGLVAMNLGLSAWYSPFGWYAWGPRLTLPILGAVGVIGVSIVARIVKSHRRWLRCEPIVTLIFLALFLSALPNLGSLLEDWAYFSLMFAPTEIERWSAIYPFNVQTAPQSVYMYAMIESVSRDIIVPVTIDVGTKYLFIFASAGASFFMIVLLSCRELSANIIQTAKIE